MSLFHRQFSLLNFAIVAKNAFPLLMHPIVLTLFGLVVDAFYDMAQLLLAMFRCETRKHYNKRASSRAKRAGQSDT